MNEREIKQSSPAKEAEAERLLRAFNNPERMEINGQVIEVFDIAPERLKTEVPTFVLPGFSATGEALKDLVLQIAKQGRRVIAFNAPHGVDTDRESELPNAEARKLEVLLQIKERKHLDRVNAIATSESAIYLTAAALMEPGKFENLVLIEPAGLVGKTSLEQLLKGMGRDTVEQIRQGRSRRKVKYPSSDAIGVKSVLSGPIQSLRELQAVAQADITGALRQLRAEGIGISIIHAVDDKIFPMAKVQAMVDADMIDGFYSVQGTHNSIYKYEPFGRAAEAAMSALEAKQDARERRKQ